MVPENADKEGLKVMQIEQKIKELTEISRIVQNTLNLVADMDIKGAMVEPVLEIVNYNRGFKQNVDQQINLLKSTLPQEAPKAEVVA